MMKNRYPVYIVSKGRAYNPMTAQMFERDGVEYKILIEKEEYANYSQKINPKNIIVLPFSNLGLGSFPARNYAWKLSIQNNHKRHWCFDDNIRSARKLDRGKKNICSSLDAIIALENFTDKFSNVGISAFNYSTFAIPESTGRKAFMINVHAYSCMLIYNDVPFRWRLKYNEDVDLCLQYLHNKWCTILLNAYTMDKTSTVAKMRGGNQDELYKGNAAEKKILKAKSLEEIWPQYAKTTIRFNRPHHYVNWVKHFKHSLKKLI